MSEGCKHAPKAHNHTNYCADCEPKSEKGCHHGYVWYTCSHCSSERRTKALELRVEKLEAENKKLRECKVCDGTGKTLFAQKKLNCLQCGGTGEEDRETLREVYQTTINQFHHLRTALKNIAENKAHQPALYASARLHELKHWKS